MDSITHITGIIGQEVDDWVILGDTELLLPGLGDKCVVDRDDVDAFDALRRELLS